MPSSGRPPSAAPPTTPGRRASNRPTATASQQEVEAETVEALHSATAILATKAPDEVGAYRQLVLGAAAAVADAKGGVKPGEIAAIDTVREALG